MHHNDRVDSNKKHKTNQVTISYNGKTLKESKYQKRWTGKQLMTYGYDEQNIQKHIQPTHSY